ncbi:DUF2752 domain-containing protein [Cellulomonas fimi]|uniref:DUF2752 domain-containing protein n=1 Tax=Cellulomonas fimi TaxID=1708 RepID=UPI00235876EA|nr:DUF2752 domain-containing protein [Cellulomonas fimi]
MTAASGSVRTPLLVGAATALATVAVALRDPHVQNSWGVCPLHVLTGLWCPGCGGLRAVHDLAHLDVAGAWGMNPLVVALVPVAVAVWAVWTWRSATGRAPLRTLPGRWAWAVLALVVTFAVLRNLPPFAPFLAP